LQHGQFDSLTYLSSTRVYINSTNSQVEENDDIIVNPNNADDLYTLTKLTGERICLSSGKNVKIARLSNIIGNDTNSTNFLTDIVSKIISTGSFTLYSTLKSSKDYLYIDDAVDLLINVAIKGNQKMYNIAAGNNTSNEEIINELKKHASFTYNIAENAREIIFPIISVDKIKAEFDFKPSNIVFKIPSLLKK
jgi:nucleoside-diphosphate-sugar epimerase